MNACDRGEARYTNLSQNKACQLWIITSLRIHSTSNKLWLADGSWSRAYILSDRDARFLNYDILDIVYQLEVEDLFLHE